MAIRSEGRGGPMAAAHFLVRTFVCLVGLVAVAWGGAFLPSLWRQAGPKRVSSEILQGHTYKMPALLNEAQQAAAANPFQLCDPAALHDAVILRIAAFDLTVPRTNQTDADPAYGSLFDATRKALACSPADSFAWLTLFWLQIGKHGYDDGAAKYLRLSYALGPNEGWIMLWRSKLALAVFERLPTDLASDALDDFIKLVETGQLYRETATIFADAAPAVQRRIVERLKTAKATPSQIFTRLLYDRGLDIVIPGVDFRPARPWR